MSQFLVIGFLMNLSDETFGESVPCYLCANLERYLIHTEYQACIPIDQDVAVEHEVAEAACRPRP